MVSEKALSGLYMRQNLKHLNLVLNPEEMINVCRFLNSMVMRDDRIEVQAECVDHVVLLLLAREQDLSNLTQDLVAL